MRYSTVSDGMSVPVRQHSQIESPLNCNVQLNFRSSYKYTRAQDIWNDVWLPNEPCIYST